ncbi:hypothetical protein E5288_WYG007439 [Bos mutus]|uniref:Uncharacterized protein n=1 Tax=Bos mutus TaxID=72004 RepID=A0A6B0S7E5_9CETA|nr:hypothetical protein [Bos mutus]
MLSIVGGLVLEKAKATEEILLNRSTCEHSVSGYRRPPQYHFTGPVPEVTPGPELKPNNPRITVSPVSVCQYQGWDDVRRGHPIPKPELIHLLEHGQKLWTGTRGLPHSTSPGDRPKCQTRDSSSSQPVLSEEALLQGSLTLGSSWDSRLGRAGAPQGLLETRRVPETPEMDAGKEAHPGKAWQGYLEIPDMFSDWCTGLCGARINGSLHKGTKAQSNSRSRALNHWVESSLKKLARSRGSPSTLHRSERVAEPLLGFSVQVFPAAPNGSYGNRRAAGPGPGSHGTSNVYGSWTGCWQGGKAEKAISKQCVSVEQVTRDRSPQPDPSTLKTLASNLKRFQVFSTCDDIEWKNLQFVDCSYLLHLDIKDPSPSIILCNLMS